MDMNDVFWIPLNPEIMLHIYDMFARGDDMIAPALRELKAQALYGGHRFPLERWSKE